MQTEFLFRGELTVRLRDSPDDDDDAVEAVVGVLDVAKEPESHELQHHLQAEQTCEHHVTDLQNICQLLRLKRSGVCGREKGGEIDVRQVRKTNKQTEADRLPVSRAAESTREQFLNCYLGRLKYGERSCSSGSPHPFYHYYHKDYSNQWFSNCGAEHATQGRKKKS